MVQQINVFLLLFGALQGGLLSFWFFRNRRREPANWHLGWLLTVAGLQLTLKVITKVWLMQNVLLLYLLSYQLPFLVGPLLLLYVRAKPDHSFRKTDAWHFLPFGLAALQIFTGLLFPAIVYDIQPPVLAMTALQLVLLAAYSGWAYRLAAPHQRQFVRVVAVTEGIIIVTLGLMVRYYGLFPDVRLLFVGLTLLIYWISYRVIAQSAPFAPAERILPPVKLQKSPKYAHSSLKPDEANRIEKALHGAMAQEKRYLDPELTIDGLAEILATNRHHLSQVLNERLGQTYADYVNGLRLEEARQRLSNPAHFRYTIAAIALDSGFNSVSSFNDVFRKQFGTTPSKFREPFLKKLSA